MISWRRFLLASLSVVAASAVLAVPAAGSQHQPSPTADKGAKQPPPWQCFGRIYQCPGYQYQCTEAIGNAAGFTNSDATEDYYEALMYGTEPLWHCYGD